MAQARRDATMDYWTRELQKIDPRLMMIKAKDSTTVPGMKPGFFHVLRVNEGAPPSLIPLETPDGEFKEPDSSVFDLLRRNDLWNREAVHDRKRMTREAVDAERRRREREQNARAEELRERVKAMMSTSVSMTNARPWAQTAKARRG